MTITEAYYWLSNIPGVGAVKVRAMSEYFGTVAGIYNIEGRELANLGILRDREIGAWEECRKNKEKILEDYHSMKEKGIRFITVEDEEYPRRLKPLYDRPFALFVKGRILQDSRPSAAIVGARKCSYYGRETAQRIARELSRAGVQIVSGLAYGIDGCGHKGALDAGGDTYGVLGCGVDICYPLQNWEMYLKMQVKGGVISEFAPGTKPLAAHFPMRNRIISGLADAVIVVEAKERSGSLITVDQALEQGKQVFALPGRISDTLSQGCNRLIKEGAEVLTDVKDVLEFFHLEGCEPGKNGDSGKIGLAINEEKVYSGLDLQPKHLEEISQECGLSIHETAAVLLKLELDGLIAQPVKNYYAVRG